MEILTILNEWWENSTISKEHYIKGKGKRVQKKDFQNYRKDFLQL
jgi:hypothetical protein